MAVYSFSVLSDGQAISFDPNSDVLDFDQTSISAADLAVAAEGGDVRIVAAGKSVLLQSVSPLELASSNVSFANGSALLFGDNSPGTANDNAANSLSGTSGNDLLQGFGGADTLNGGAGDDRYLVGAGDVLVDSGGVDTVVSDVNWALGAGFENLTLAGSANINGAGNDLANLIIQNDGNNVTWAGRANDTVLGGAGNDYLGGDAGNDWLDGQAGNDTLDGGGDKDHFAFSLYGTANADTAVAFASSWDDIQLDIATFGALGTNGQFSSTDARFYAAAGATSGHDTDDRIIYNTSTGQLFYDADGSGSGAAQIIGTFQGAPTLRATDIHVFGTPASTGGTINGTSGDDTLVGTSGDDTIDGLQGNDDLSGGGGDDILFGDFGDDRLDGGDGNDTLTGFRGADTLFGGGGDDQLFANNGFSPDEGADDTAADSLVGGDGNDTLMGNVGDTLDGGAGSDNYIVWGNATLVDSAGIDSATAHLDGGSYVLAAGIENLQLISSQQVAVTGNSLDNSIIGSAAADAIDGLAGFDTLNGLGGDDTLAGGAGVDSLWGGAGADEFILDQLGTADADGINDFETGTDQLVLDGSVLTAIGASGEFAPDDMRFYAAAGATSGHDSSDRIIYDTSGLHLWYDPDGSGPAASQLIGAFTSGIDIAAPDFIVIDGTSSGAINGTEGDDTLVGTPGDDTINGLDGNDSISGLEGDDSLSGGDGNDTLAGGPGTDTLDGGFGDDVYVDPAGDVLIDAGGTDTVIGFETSPFLPAGFENLILRGGPFVIGNEDFASSGQGNELDNLIVNERSDPTGLYGEGGNDTLIGSAAADYFVYVGSSDFGHDSVDGGGGFNTFVFEALDTPVTVDFGTGTVTSALGSVSFADVQQALGTSGNDSMVGGDSAVRLFGEDGSDTLVGGAGNDFLDAADYYSGYWSATTGNDSLLGGGGDDTLIGGVGNDFIDGGAGNDQLEAGTFWVDDVGDDTLTGGSGNDTISGGGGADRFVFDQTPGTANADHLTDFASSDDQIHLDATVMTQLGASGAFAVGDARFYAAAGASAGHDADDRVVYDTGSGNLWYDADGSGATAALLIATLDGPAALAATDIVVLNGTTPPSGPIDGTSGDDSLVGTAGDDTINGLEGNDTLMGFGGNDVLDGGPGTDSMDGGAGDDSYYVTAGDVLTDASGVDTVLSDGDWSLGLDFENITLLGTGNWDVQGFNADNLAIGNAGDNYFNMRDGNDTILAGAGDDSIDMSTGGTSSYGNDSIDGGDGTDTVDFAGYARSGVMVNVALGTIAGGGDAGAGSATIANVERVIGGDFNDSFTGDSQGNQFDGRAGDDSLAGGAGNDLLTGGAGADSFLFADVGTANADSVSDFTTGSDEIHLDADAMAALGTSGQFSSADARFYEASGASSGHDADDRVIYDTASGNLWYDADGSGAGSALLIATLQGSASLAATDIFVENGSAPPPPPPSGSIDGTSANDSLVGTTGDDTINGLEGNDTLRGLDGNDVLDGGPGTDLLDGGAGNDTYYVTAGDTLTDSGGVDTVLSGVNWSLGAGFENLTLTGSADLRSGGNDLANLITQNSGDNVTWAGRGDDTILGADGNDYLGGDANNDWLDGQAGNDTLDGGGDKDHFVFSSYGAADADVVRSFATAWDDLEFDASAFSALGAPGDFGSGDARFYAASGASSGHDAADRLIYDTSTGRLYYDDDGSGSHAAQLVATLEGAPSLAASDISVV